MLAFASATAIPTVNPNVLTCLIGIQFLGNVSIPGIPFQETSCDPDQTLCSRMDVTYLLDGKFVNVTTLSCTSTIEYASLCSSATEFPEGIKGAERRNCSSKSCTKSDDCQRVASLSNDDVLLDSTMDNQTRKASSSKIIDGVSATKTMNRLKKIFKSVTSRLRQEVVQQRLLGVKDRLRTQNETTRCVKESKSYDKQLHTNQRLVNITHQLNETSQLLATANMNANKLDRTVLNKQASDSIMNVSKEVLSAIKETENAQLKASCKEANKPKEAMSAIDRAIGVAERARSHAESLVVDLSQTISQMGKKGNADVDATERIEIVANELINLQGEKEVIIATTIAELIQTAVSSTLDGSNKTHHAGFRNESSTSTNNVRTTENKAVSRASELASEITSMPTTPKVQNTSISLALTAKKDTSLAISEDIEASSELNEFINLNFTPNVLDSSKINMSGAINYSSHLVDEISTTTTVEVGITKKATTTRSNIKNTGLYTSLTPDKEKGSIMINEITTPEQQKTSSGSTLAVDSDSTPATQSVQLISTRVSDRINEGIASTSSVKTTEDNATNKVPTKPIVGKPSTDKVSSGRTEAINIHDKTEITTLSILNTSVSKSLPSNTLSAKSVATVIPDKASATILGVFDNADGITLQHVTSRNPREESTSTKSGIDNNIINETTGQELPKPSTSSAFSYTKPTSHKVYENIETTTTSSESADETNANPKPGVLSVTNKTTSEINYTGHATNEVTSKTKLDIVDKTSAVNSQVDAATPVKRKEDTTLQTFHKQPHETNLPTRSPMVEFSTAKTLQTSNYIIQVFNEASANTSTKAVLYTTKTAVVPTHSTKDSDYSTNVVQNEKQENLNKTTVKPKILMTSTSKTFSEVKQTPRLFNEVGKTKPEISDTMSTIAGLSNAVKSTRDSPTSSKDEVVDAATTQDVLKVTTPVSKTDKISSAPTVTTATSEYNSNVVTTNRNSEVSNTKLSDTITVAAVHRTNYVLNEATLNTRTTYNTAYRLSNATFAKQDAPLLPSSTKELDMYDETETADGAVTPLNEVEISTHKSVITARSNTRSTLSRKTETKLSTFPAGEDILTVEPDKKLPNQGSGNKWLSQSNNDDEDQFDGEEIDGQTSTKIESKAQKNITKPHDPYHDEIGDENEYIDAGEPEFDGKKDAPAEVKDNSSYRTTKRDFDMTGLSTATKASQYTTSDMTYNKTTMQGEPRKINTNEGGCGQALRFSFLMTIINAIAMLVCAQL